MDYKRFIKSKGRILKDKILEDKRLLYFLIAIILLLLIYTLFVREYVKEQEEERRARQEQAEEETRVAKKEEKLKYAKFSRISFFLTGPIRASLAIPDYLEGNYRVKEAGNKMSFLYIEDPEVVSPFFHIRYFEKGSADLEEGEVEVREVKSKKDSKTYVFVYYIYPEDSYPKEEKEGFVEALWDMENIIIESLKTS